MDESRAPRLTYKVHLPGGQSRLREAALYVMQKCKGAEFFGLTKLNKILWKADFTAFASRRVPVTGRQYQRLQQGPAPVEMLPVLNDLERDGYIKIARRLQGHLEEKRPVALVEPALRFFSADDLSYLDAAIEQYWSYSGRGVSADSHGVAWETRENGDPMPYELSLLSDEKLSAADSLVFLDIGRKRGWRTQ
ncbi:Panacea domain-containing protein [Tsuneonella amylolytica]|uniref:Panacea domain-containing protein n=1 Tax=Tsuneonella amylolytica TaxID=2338327 RepID=UPI000EA95124|nr:Panacea domain-containing protein [Tsuneonella amylolytica]